MRNMFKSARARARLGGLAALALSAFAPAVASGPAGYSTINSLAPAVYSDQLQQQFLVKNGRVYKRVETDWNRWMELTLAFEGANPVGSGEITAFDTEVYTDGKLRQFLTRGSRVLRHTEADWNTWDDINSIFLAPGRSTDPRVHEPIYKRVMVIEYNPTLYSQGTPKPLSEYFPYHYSPRVLEQNYIHHLEEASSQVVQYAIARHVKLEAFPPRTDVPTYTEASYLACLANDSCPRQETFDYRRVMAEQRVGELANAGRIDELWLWGGPYFGFAETNIAGPGAFHATGAPVLGTSCNVKVHIMGFNYEREVERMLEDMGHRVEGTLRHYFNDTWRNGYLQLPNPRAGRRQPAGALHRARVRPHRAGLRQHPRFAQHAGLRSAKPMDVRPRKPHVHAQYLRRLGKLSGGDRSQ